VTSSIERAKNKSFAEWREWKTGGKPPHSKVPGEEGCGA